MEEKNNWRSPDRILVIVFAFLFVATLYLFIVYALSREDDFSEGWDASYTYQQAQEYFLGDDDPHLAVVTHNDGSRVSLEPSGYGIYSRSSSGKNSSERLLGQITIEGGFYELSDLFHRTTNIDIDAVYNFGEWDREIAYVDPKEDRIIIFDDNAYDWEGLGEGDSVIFNHLEYGFSIDLNDDCEVNDEVMAQYEGYDIFEGLVTECNKTGSVYVSKIFVNDQIAYEFSPLELTRMQGGPEAPMGYSPNTRFRLIGVGPDLEIAYFKVLDQTFSINSDGVVEQEEFPDDMVTMEWE